MLGENALQASSGEDFEGAKGLGTACKLVEAGRANSDLGFGLVGEQCSHLAAFKQSGHVSESVASTERAAFFLSPRGFLADISIKTALNIGAHQGAISFGGVGVLEATEVGVVGEFGGVEETLDVVFNGLFTQSGDDFAINGSATFDFDKFNTTREQGVEGGGGRIPATAPNFGPDLKFEFVERFGVKVAVQNTFVE